MTKRIFTGIFILTAVGALGIIIAGALAEGDQLIVRFLTAVVVAALGLYVISDLRLQADQTKVEGELVGAGDFSMRQVVDDEIVHSNSTAAFMDTITKPTRRGGIFEKRRKLDYLDASGPIQLDEDEEAFEEFLAQNEDVLNESTPLGENNEQYLQSYDPITAEQEQVSVGGDLIEMSEYKKNSDASLGFVNSEDVFANGIAESQTGYEWPISGEWPVTEVENDPHSLQDQTDKNVELLPDLEAELEHISPLVENVTGSQPAIHDTIDLTEHVPNIDESDEVAEEENFVLDLSANISEPNPISPDHPGSALTATSQLVRPSEVSQDQQTETNKEMALASVIDLRKAQSVEVTSNVDSAIKAGEKKVVSTLVDQGMLSTDGELSDRDVRTMVYVAFTSNELRKLIKAGGNPNEPNSGLELGPVELFDESVHAPAPKRLYQGRPTPE